MTRRQVRTFTDPQIHTRRLTVSPSHRLTLSSFHRLTACIALTLSVCAASHATVRTDSTSASNVMTNGASLGAQSAVSGGDFSFFAWIRPAGFSAAEASYFRVGGAMEVHLLQGGAFRVRLLNGANPPLQATLSAGLQPSEWALVAFSYDQQAARLDLWAVSQSQPLTSTSATLPGFVIGSPGIGTVGSFGGAPAMLGIYGATALRDHAITAADVLDVWNSRLHHGPYIIDNLATGGSMDGPEGCIFMINHAVTTRPINHAGGTQHQIAALVGGPSTVHNYHIFSRVGGGSGSLRVVRLLSAAQGFVNHSVYDPPGDGFFVRPLPALSEPLPEPHYVEGEAPTLRQLGTNPQGLLRVMTSANSRAVQAPDGSLGGTGNYAHGFIALKTNKTAGIFNRPARLDDDYPWFGFDATAHAPYAAGVVAEIRFHNFSRFWTGANNSGSLGPGEGVHLAPGASYALRCKPQGMITANQPLVIQAHLLKYPGASDVTWVPNIHSRQGEAGTDVGKPTTVALDTQHWSHVLSSAAGDSVPSASRIILAGNHVANVAVNDAVAAGPCISLVSSVSYSAQNNTTTIDFEHPFSVVPDSGGVLRFGQWGYKVIEHEWAGVDPNSENVWRGLRLTAAGSTGHGAIVFSYSAWRPGVNGYVFGTSGWAGWGYFRQIIRSFDAAIEAWMAELAPDVWLQMFAQQNAQPFHMAVFKDRIRNALPGIEIVWLGDYEHETGGTYEDWHRFILENAEAEDVLAITALMDDRIGSYDALLDDGLRSDNNHINERGNTRLAEVWTEKLLLAAIDPNQPNIPGDLNGDGVVNVFDLLILLESWGDCAIVNNCPADLNGDGAVNVFDLLILLENWG